MTATLSPSIICMDFTRFAEQIRGMDEFVSMYHVDVMDAHFVPNLGLYPGVIRDLKRLSGNTVDCHLMTDEPAFWVPKIIEAGADIVSLHAETITTGAFSLIDAIHGAGRRFGVVLNPATPLSAADAYLPFVDELTVMTIEPGFPGGRFIPEMLAKIREAKRVRDERNLHYKICMDGSCCRENFPLLRDAGADVFVVGTAALFSQSDDITEACRKMMRDFQILSGKGDPFYE